MLEKQTWRVCVSPQRENKVCLVKNATWHQSWKLANWGKLDLRALLCFREGHGAVRHGTSSAAWLDAAAGMQTVCSLKLSKLQTDASIIVPKKKHIMLLAIPRIHSCPARFWVLWFSMFESWSWLKNHNAISPTDAESFYWILSKLFEEKIHTKIHLTIVGLIFKGYFQSCCLLSVKFLLSSVSICFPELWRETETLNGNFKFKWELG